MKIIGLDGQGNFLCSVSPVELRRITQFEPPETYSGSAVATDRNGTNKWIGQEFDLSPAWNRLYKLEYSRKELDAAIRQLRLCADLLEPLSPLVNLEDIQEGPNEPDS